MFHSTDSHSSSIPNFRLIEQALSTLKQSVSSHLEQESRLERMYLGWQQKWLSQCDQLRNRIESLEAQLAPWMQDRTESPRLAIVSQNDEQA